MTRKELFDQILLKQSCLCVGLDSEISRIPIELLSEPDPIFSFNEQIVRHTSEYAIAYKPNIAFYESLGSKGWNSLEKTIDILPPDTLTIADAKRGDIGNTSKMYAKTYFEYFDFDAVTVNPYMGLDTMECYLEYTDKWVIVLGLTSNEGSKDFEQQKLENGEKLYEKVMKRVASWGNPDNIMFVVGATHPQELAIIRSQFPQYFFLVPGVGAQGGDISETLQNGMNDQCGVIINSSRQVLYHDDDSLRFGAAAGQVAKQIKSEMSTLLSERFGPF